MTEHVVEDPSVALSMSPRLQPAVRASTGWPVSNGHAPPLPPPACGPGALTITAYTESGSTSRLVHGRQRGAHSLGTAADIADLSPHACACACVSPTTASSAPTHQGGGACSNVPALKEELSSLLRDRVPPQLMRALFRTVEKHLDQPPALSVAGQVAGHRRMEAPATVRPSLGVGPPSASDIDGVHTPPSAALPEGGQTPGSTDTPVSGAGPLPMSSSPPLRRGALRKQRPHGDRESTSDDPSDAVAVGTSPAREAERLAAREAALCIMQRDAALSALSAMQEMWGAPSAGVTSAEELLVAQSRVGALQTAATCKAECAALRDELRRLRASEAATRARCTQQLGSLAHACNMLVQTGIGEANEKMKRDVLESIAAVNMAARAPRDCMRGEAKADAA